ncbi:MAG: DUF5606 domain-containing protein [Bacteroidota bacterium]
MNLEKIVAITGANANGVFTMIVNKGNGLIVENIETGKRKFVPSRRHNFTPMNTVGIYLDNGQALDIDKVFKKMMEQEKDNPPVDANSSSKVLREYFTDILPTHDENKVYTSDIKRVIKWYLQLKKHGFLEETNEAKEQEEESSLDNQEDSTGE